MAHSKQMDGAEVEVAGQRKAGRGMNVPLSRRARALLAMVGDGAPDEPIAPGTCDTLLRRAAKAAGLVKLHFHDSRREATTHIAPKDGNSMDLAKNTGHDYHRQLMEYFEPGATELAKKLG